jgi:uncharacterized protein YraI
MVSRQQPAAHQQRLGCGGVCEHRRSGQRQRQRLRTASSAPPAVWTPRRRRPPQFQHLLTPSDGAPVAVVVPARMNVRSGPGTGYPVVTSAANGARLPILARSPGGDWYQVQIEGRADPAWVFASLTVVDGALANAPTLSAEQIPALPVVEQPVAAPCQLQPSGGARRTAQHERRLRLWHHRKHVAGRPPARGRCGQAAWLWLGEAADSLGVCRAGAGRSQLAGNGHHRRCDERQRHQPHVQRRHVAGVGAPDIGRHRRPPGGFPDVRQLPGVYRRPLLWPPAGHRGLE